MKVTIKGIIKENREQLLEDKISNFILDDTVVEVKDDIKRVLIFFPFYGSKNNYSMSNYTFERVLPILLQRMENLSTRSPEIFTYIQDTYGIDDPTIINNISYKYYSSLYYKIKYLLQPIFKPINESVDNREELIINKISNFILDDTVVKMDQRLERVEIFFPFYGSQNHNPLKGYYNKYTFERVLPILLQRKENINTLSPEILTYIMYTYGVEDWDLMVKITKRYYSLLYDKIKELLESNTNSINESVNNREELIVNKISEYMLDDTEYEYNQRSERVIIFFPFYRVENYYTLDKVLPILLNRGYDIDFINYVQRTYSIKDWNLIVNISHRYYRLLYDRIKELLESNTNPINESVEKKEEVLNRIVDFMIQDTKWDVHMEHEDDWEYVQVTIYYPGGDSDEYKTKDMSKDWDIFHTNGNDDSYIKDNFGITEKWIIQELYDRYIKKLRPIIYEEMKNFENNY